MRRFSCFALARLLFLGLVFLGSFAPSLAGAEPWPTHVPPVSQEVSRLMQDRDYPAALATIEKALKAKETPKPKEAPHDYLAYLRGRALSLAGRHDDAVAAFQGLETRFPKSRWVRWARFGRAMALARMADFRGAELIYRAEAETLFGIDRKQEIAAVYLEFADNAFNPPEEEAREPDYAKALTFYTEALRVGVSPEKQIEVELLQARCFQELGKHDEAIARIEPFLESHPGSPSDVEARFRLGACYFDAGHPKQARRAWQDLLAAHPESPSPWIAEAAYRLAQTWGLPKAVDDEALSRGVAALEAFCARFPEHASSGRAHLDIAVSYVRRTRYDQAAEGLTRFLADARYKNSEEIPEARVLLGRIYQKQKKFDEAQAVWREYLAEHSVHKAWNQVQKRVVNTEYLAGWAEFQAERYDVARKLWSDFLERHPLDRRNSRILFHFAEIHVAEKKWEEAVAAWRRVVSKYAETDEETASEAQLMIAATLELELGKLEEAVKEYGKVTWGEHFHTASRAISRLTSKALTVTTERTFRSNEVPALELATRNVPEVSARVYEIDLETYFRKMHLADGIEQLDIRLIDPDHVVEHEVPGYAKLREVESRIELPRGDAPSGVWAVTVSGKKFEATTLVIQSDLDILVKSSRDEVFVFAENMRTGKPWPGVKLLLSNGQQVFDEATTGPDGVFQKTYRELQEADDIRVFARAEGNVASNVVGLQGVAVAQGLADKGYICTDRPAYRAGDRVEIRGCLRRAVDDAYTFEKGKKYTLEAFDSRNRLLHRKEVTLGRFGTFADRFVLPPICAQGTHRLLVRDTEGRSYQGSFRVRGVDIEPIRLVVDTPRRIYCRGETIEGVLRATYSFGAPLVDHELVYQLGDGSTHTARTDEKGEVRFSLATREFREVQELPLEVTLPGKNLTVTETLHLATHGFGIQVRSVRSLYLAGETFEVTLETRDVAGKPVARELELSVFEETTLDEATARRLVESHPLQTAAADGVARHTFQLDEAGRYLVRAEGTDRFGTKVWGEMPLAISGDDDATRLHVLADRHAYRVGDTARVKLHWREKPALALVAFQGARVLGYELVPLQTGLNDLSIPITARLAPNFELAVAVMTDARRAPDSDEALPLRFHQATSPFTVERDLQLAIATKGKGGKRHRVLPGETFEVTLETTDSQGKPVAAEVSLAMVERTLLERFDWPVAPIDQFFRGNRREPAVRTSSSITFAYHPATQPINSRLLSERLRLEIAQAEEASLRESRARDAARRKSASGFGRQSPSPSPMTDDPFGLGDDRPFDEPAPAVPDASGDPFADPVGPVAPDDPFGLANDNPFGKTVDPFPSSAGSIAGMMGYRPPTSAEEFSEEADSASGQATGPGRLSRLPLAETGYWNASIVTGDDGTATVTLTMPERPAAWSLLAKGITTETLAGEASCELVAANDFFGRLDIPAALTEGDEAQVIAAVHNEALDQGTIEVTLKTTVAGQSVEERKRVEVTSKGIHELAFPIAPRWPEGKKPGPEPANRLATDVLFELTVVSGERRHTVRRVVPLRPYGLPVFSASSGSATADTTTWAEAPNSTRLLRPKLEVFIGPTVERSLLDIVLAPTPASAFVAARICTRIESATSDLMASLSLVKLLDTTQQAGRPESRSLDGRIRASIRLLVSAQRDDGSWSWSAAGGKSNRHATARIVWALARARAAAYPVPDETYRKAVANLATQLNATSNTDYQTKAILLHALTVAGKSDFSVANRLYRDRPSLSAAALAHLALTFVAMDRKATAGEILDLLAKRDLDRPGKSGGPGEIAWISSPVGVRGLYALAIQRVRPQAPEAKAPVDWLLAHRTGHRWAPDRATGVAAMALCRWFAQSRFEGEPYRLEVLVNEVRAKVLEIDANSRTQRIEVAGSFLREGKQRISFRMTGRGRYTYQCVLGGYVAADQVKSTTDDWEAVRTVTPAPLQVDGREIPRGFGIVRGKLKRFRNSLRELPVGGRALVELAIRRRSPPNRPDGHLEYLVVTEPIPSGAIVLEKWVSGPFERFEISPGQITFYVGNRRAVGTIRYQLYGHLRGKYRAGPTVIRNAHRPEEMVVSRQSPLSVLARGAKSSDEYRLTPVERHFLGKHYFAKADLARAGEHLTALFDEWTLDAKTHREVVKMLLDVHLDRGTAAEAVRFFEIIMERWPKEQIPFEKSLKIAAAYHEIGEFERSYLAFRAIIEARFTQDTSLAGFLETQGEFVRGVEAMERLLAEYPPEPYAASAAYRLAQHVYARASTAADDPKLVAAKLTRVELVSRASQMLHGFLTAHSEDPAADQAALARAGALLEIEAFDEARAACTRYAARYAESPLLDSFWYVAGYCNFLAGRHEEAVAMCRKVADMKRTDPDSGREVESRNKWQAVYILGQVYHSLGQAAKAIAEYRKVEDRFDDARKSIAYFLRKSIGLPEITTVLPGEAAEVELTFRNVVGCDVKVYRIDLMKFSLLRQSLSHITRINLAGIRPLHETSQELGDGRDYRDRAHTLSLPIQEEGAYLVVARGTNLHACGLVLVTPLSVEVENDSATGQVRVTVKNSVADRCENGVDVRVIGSGNSDFVSGSSDLRGLFVAEGIVGTPTVIARAGRGQYAFSRGVASILEPGSWHPATAATAPTADPLRFPRMAWPQQVRSQAAGRGNLAKKNEARIQAALKSPTAFDFMETPLQEVVDYLGNLHGIPIEIDQRALDDVGIPGDTPITRRHRGITLRSALHLVLRDLDLTYLVQDENLVITTLEEAETRVTSTIYPVADLVRCKDKSGELWSDFDSLIELISTTVNPMTWDDVGGPGSIAPMQVGETDALVILQTDEIHDEVAELLANMRTLAGIEGSDPEPPVRERPGYPGGMGGRGGMMSGRGGMMGGMGGGFFGQGMGGMQQELVAPGSAPPGSPGTNDLLQGLHDENRKVRSEEAEKLNRMYQKGGGMGGMGGVGAGGFF